VTLHEAVARGNRREVERQIAKGADVTARDDQGNTPLAYLQCRVPSFAPILQALLAAGADIDALESGAVRETALMRAVRARDLGAVEGLLVAGSDPTVRSAAGRTVLDIAVETGSFAASAVAPETPPMLELIARLERAGASRGEPYTLCGAARCDDLVTVRALLDAGAPVDEPERGWTLATLRLQRAVGNPGEFADRGQTALAIAANRGHLDVCRVLLDAGADPRVRPHPSLPGFTLLTAAATGGDVELCRTLLARGLDVDGGFAVGTRRLGTNRPLCAAAMAGQVEAVRFLLEAGADASAHDARRDPGALYYARASAAPDGRKHAIFALLGADVAVESAVQIAQLARRRAGKPALTPVPPDVLDTVGTLLGQTGKPWKRRRAVYQFFKKDLSTIGRAREAAQAHGCLLVFNTASRALFETGPERSTEVQSLLLFGTDDVSAVIAAVGTNGANHGVENDDVIDWMRDLARAHPFDLTGCGFDFLAGRFRAPLGDAAVFLASRMLAFCPDLRGVHPKPAAALADDLQRRNAFYFWWD
jgi:ankyrin repeat protein